MAAEILRLRVERAVVVLASMRPRRMAAEIAVDWVSVVGIALLQ